MFGSRSLEAVRIAVLAADGVEQVELTRPVKALEKHGASVEIVSLHRRGRGGDARLCGATGVAGAVNTRNAPTPRRTCAAPGASPIHGGSS